MTYKLYLSGSKNKVLKVFLKLERGKSQSHHADKFAGTANKKNCFTGKPPMCTAWLCQCVLYAALATFAKSALALVLRLPRVVAALATLPLSPISNPKLEIAVVMLIIPFFVNVSRKTSEHHNGFKGRSVFRDMHIFVFFTYTIYVVTIYLYNTIPIQSRGSIWKP